MNREEAHQYLKGRNLSDVLTKDLKIPKDSFMVVRKGETLKGTLDGRTEDPYGTINNENLHQLISRFKIMHLDTEENYPQVLQVLIMAPMQQAMDRN